MNLPRLLGRKRFSGIKLVQIFEVKTFVTDFFLVVSISYWGVCNNVLGDGLACNSGDETPGS